MPTLLLIEDEAMLRSNLARGLSKIPDATVHDAGSLEEALPLLDLFPPDLIVSDIDLPRRTGIEILGELAARRLRVPVIFVTGFVRAYGAQIPRHEDVDVLEKPIALEDLRAAVERRLRPHDPDRPSAPFGVPDYMQLAGMGRHSVIIETHVGGRLRGCVTVVRGEAWSARDDRGVGAEALRRIAFEAEGIVSCRSLVGPPGDRDLDGSWEWVLLEAARDLDEGDVRSPEPEPARAPEADPFEEAFDEGIVALLRKDLGAAAAAFAVARAFRPDDPKVLANLDRLAQLGFPVDELPRRSRPIPHPEGAAS